MMLTEAEHQYVLEVARNLTKSPGYRYYSSSQAQRSLSPPCVPVGVEGTLQLLCVFFVLAALVFQGIISLWMALVKRSRRYSLYKRASKRNSYYHHHRPMHFVVRQPKKTGDKSGSKTTSVSSRRSQQQQQQGQETLTGRLSVRKFRKMFDNDRDDEDNETTLNDY